MHMHICLHMAFIPGIHRNQKRVSDPLEFEQVGYEQPSKGAGN